MYSLSYGSYASKNVTYESSTRLKFLKLRTLAVLFYSILWTDGRTDIAIYSVAAILKMLLTSL